MPFPVAPDSRVFPLPQFSTDSRRGLRSYAASRLAIDSGERVGGRQNVPQFFDEWKLVNVLFVLSFPQFFRIPSGPRVNRT